MSEGAEGRSSYPSSALWPAAIITLAACVYGATAPQHVLGPDNPEFATLFRVGGVAHPSGYPLYVLYLRAMRWLPGATPAHGAALATALTAVLALVLLYRACRALGASVGASSIVLAAHAFSARAWILATHAEVFAMNAAIAAAIVWVAVERELVGVRRVALLGLLAGLGLSNHHSIVLLAPIGLYGAVRGVREARASMVAVAAGLCTLLLGLLPYAYLLYVGRAPNGHFVWGDVRTLSELWFHFRRGEYGSTTFAVQSQRADRLGQVVLLVVGTLTGLLFLPLFALFGLRRRPRAQTLCLAASLLLAGPLFVVLFNLTTEGLDRIVVERFHLLPQALTAMLIAPALDPIVSRARHAIVAAVPVAAISALIAYVDVREHNRPSVELYVRNTLAIAPPNAIVIGGGDHRFGGFLYAREALGLRRDVVYLDARMLFHPWYHRRMSNMLGIELVAPKEHSLSTVALAAQLLATGRPVFLANVVSETLAARYRSYPVGTLRRLLDEKTELPPPNAVEQWNDQAFAQMKFEPTLPEPGTWGGDLQRSYAAPWLTLEEVWRAVGALDRAETCRKKAQVFLPDAR